MALITLNRPQALNALNARLVGEINAALDAFDADPAIGCIVITGSEKAFAAGADIKEMQDKAFPQSYLEDFITAWDRVAARRKPIIAAVAGFALGGGCELAMMCDFILAADTAKFGQPEIKLGVMPGAGGTQRLTRFVGKSKAMEMCLTGRMMDAAEAERSGLVSRVVPAADLLDEAMKTAAAIAAHVAAHRHDDEGKRQPGLRDHARRGHPVRAARLPRHVRHRMTRRKAWRPSSRSASQASGTAERMEIGFETIVTLGLVALGAGFVDSIAGGGGLLTVPALLLAGFDPVTAIATNKLQGSFGTASATFSFARAGRIDWRAVLPDGRSWRGSASMGGALAVRLMPASLLGGIVPILMIAMALYFALSPSVGDADAKSRIGPVAFTATLVPVVGFYDGFFGPGAGSFYMVGFVTLLGFGVVKALASTKALNLASNLGSLSLYIAAGLVVWPVGLVMGAASLTGAQIGSRLAIRMGARLIRPLIVIVCCAVAIRLLMDPANPLAGRFPRPLRLKCVTSVDAAHPVGYKPAPMSSRSVRPHRLDYFQINDAGAAHPEPAV